MPIILSTTGRLMLSTSGLLYIGGAVVVVPPPSGNWYETVFAYRDGTGVGPRVGTWTDAATWGAATAGVSVSATNVTVTADDLTITGIDFGGRRVTDNGDRNIWQDCIGVISTDQGGGINAAWDFKGLNTTVRYNRVTNPSRIGGIKTFRFNTATGTISCHHNDTRDIAGDDPIKGPEPGSTLQLDDCLFKGVHLVTNAHIDTMDFRGADPGSYARNVLVIGDGTAESVPSGTGTGFNNAGVRIDPTDPHGSKGHGTIFEQLIIVGHDDPLAQGNMFDIGDATTTGIVMYDILYDLREHGGLCQPDMRVADWYVRSFDYAASLTAGTVTGISAPVPFPNLGAQPAAVPSTMAAPVITGGSGTISWADNARPANQRDLITRYDLRYSTDGTSWTTVTDVTLAAGVTAVSSGSNYRVQFRAVNGIGVAAWSASSNLVTVSAGLTSLSITEATSPVYDANPFGTQFAAVGATITHDVPNVELQYQIFEADTPANIVVDWTDFTAGAGASTLLVMAVPQNVESVKARIRGKIATGVTATQINEWYPGNNGVWLGQSLASRPLDFNVPTVTFVPPANRLWMIVNDFNGSAAAGPAVVNGSSNLGLRRAAAVFAKYNAPRTIWVDGTMQGTGIDELVDDSKTGRDWTDTLGVSVARVRAVGTDVSCVMDHWLTNQAVVKTELERYMAPAYLRQMLDGVGDTGDGSGLTSYVGATVNVVPTSGKPYVANHYLWDLTGASGGLFDESYTKWVPFWGASFKNLSAVSDGGSNFDDANKSKVQDSLRQMPTGTAFSQISLESVVGWTGQSEYGGHLAAFGGTHVAVNDIDGESLVAVYMAHAYLRAQGVLPREEPKIVGQTWGAAGAYVDIDISLPHGGNLSTAYIENGAGSYAGTIEATEWVTPSVLPETSIAELHNVQGFAVVRGSTQSYINFTTTITDTGSGVGAARKGTVRLTPTVAFASGTDGYSFGYIEGAHTLDGTDTAAGRPHIHLPLETRTHADGCGYGYPVVRAPNTSVIAIRP